MKKPFLLPRNFRIGGLITLPLAIALLVAVYCFEYSFHPLSVTARSTSSSLHSSSDFLLSHQFTGDLTGEIAILALIASLFTIAFSRLKVEDEYVAAIRLQALQVSVYANYFILAITSILVYGFSFLLVMEANLFTILILFILVFNFNMYVAPRLSKPSAA